MGSKSRFFKLGLYNPCSLNTGHSDFIFAMDSLNCDIVAINESWLKVGQEALAPRVPGYKFCKTPRPLHMKGGKGGGVGFYIRRGISARIQSHPVADIEQMWLLVSVNRSHIAIGTAYRPEWIKDDVFIDALTESVAHFSGFDGVVILGDFNINLQDSDCNMTKKFYQFLDYTGLSQAVTTPTHFSSTTETLIDLVCTDCRFRDVQVTNVTGSLGHAFVSVVLNIKRESVAPKTVVFRPLKDVCRKIFDEDMLEIDWSLVTDGATVDAMVESFVNIITCLLDKHAPLKTVLIKNKPAPWLTDTIKKMMACRNEAHEKFKTTKLERDKIRYKELKSFATQSIYAETRAYYDYCINSQVKNEKKLWKNLKKEVLSSSQNDEYLPDHFNNPDVINDHFLNVPGTNDVPLSQLTFFEFNRYQENLLFTLEPVSEQEIARILLSIKTNAQGVDGLSMDMVLLTLPHTLSLITTIVNESIVTSTFPKQWKIATVNPIPKIPNPIEIKDLRPISILPVLSKVIEKVVYNQLSRYVERNNLLPDVQSGFRKGRGTTTALLDVVDNILAEEDHGLGTVLVLLDFSRAFDSLNIPLLLSKLSYYGVAASSIKWFDSYLSDRSQYVKINRADGSQLSSPLRNLNRGVPQGSILGPLLFVLYSADITWSIKNCKFHLYADDVQLYLPMRPKEVTNEIVKVNEDLDRIATWSCKNALVLNPTKSKFMVLGSKRVTDLIATHSLDLNIFGQRIEQVHEAKNLGLLLDSSLRFESHILGLVRNCFFRLKLLYKIKTFLNESIRIKVCEALILSKLNYGDLVYGPRLTSKTARLVQRIQNACCRFCYDVPPRTHITPYLNKSSALNMAARRDLHLAVLVHSVMAFGIPEYLFKKLNRSRTKYSTRPTRDLLHYSKHKTVAFRGSFRYQATKCWNNIPPPIRLLKSKYSFKIHYKTHLIQLQKTGLSGTNSYSAPFAC